MSSKFSQRLDKICACIAEDKPLYKPEGENKKSAEGAHRPDKGTKFKQLSFSTQFSNMKSKNDYRP